MDSITKLAKPDTPDPLVDLLADDLQAAQHHYRTGGTDRTGPMTGLRLADGLIHAFAAALVPALRQAAADAVADAVAEIGP